ncbi:unnamed protein product, partial [Prorocentrum cordatum]
SGGKRLVRNVSLHVKRCPQAGAPWSEWKAAQHEGRLPGGAAAAAAIECDVECEVIICEAEASLFRRRVKKLHVEPQAEVLRPGEWQALGEKYVVWGAGAFVDGLAAGWSLAEACPPCDVGVLTRELGPYLSENAAEACLPEAGAGAAEVRGAAAGVVSGLLEAEAEAAPEQALLLPSPPGGSEAATACAAAPTAAASSAAVAEYLAAHPAALLSGGVGEEPFDEIEKSTCEEHDGQAEQQEPEAIGFELNGGEDDGEDQNELEAHVSGDGAGDEQGGGARASRKEPPSIIEEPTCEEHEGQAEQREPEDIGFELNNGEFCLEVADVEAVAAAATRQYDCVEALRAIGMQ